MAAPGKRGTTNRNARGGSAARRIRKQWLLDTFGDGENADCFLRLPGCCGWVDFATVWVDRKTKGCEGGTYERDNIRPACGPCNMRDGGQEGQRRMRARRK
jgi:hypothetical protein